MSSIEIPSQGFINGIKVPLCKFSEADADCQESSVTAYLGIPFAEPPIGSLRWKRPQKPAPSWKSKGIRQSEWKGDPMQDLRMPEFLSIPRRDTLLDEEGESTISEDCLYLNFWVPNEIKESSSSRNLPVLVWIYGGSFVFGSASQAGFDGARLCNETGCIVVTLSYRVGVFGFLGSRELADQSQSEGTGNYGAWDVIAGLEWIQENISAFGGDSDNVTAFGESAGSIMIHYLILSTETPPNLFARAILESGTAISVLPRTIPSAQATFDTIVSKLEVAPTATDEEKLEKMYKASAEDLLTISSALPGRRPRTEYRIDASNGRPDRRMDHDQGQLTLESQSLFGPVWDGVFVGTDFLERATRGLPSSDQLRNGQKGILLGYCADEGSIFNMTVQSPQALQHHAFGFHPSILPWVNRLYGVEHAKDREDCFAACAGYSGDVLFQAPIRSLMLQLANQQKVPAYGYLFAHRPSKVSQFGTSTEGTVDLLQMCGAAHTAEVAFVFGNDGTERRIFKRQGYPGKDSRAHCSATEGFTTQEQALSLTLMRSVGRFSRQEAPWTALNDMNHASKPNAEEDCHLFTIGRFPTLGSKTPISKAATVAYDDEAYIPVCEQKLGDNITWTEKVGPAHALDRIGSQKERQAFWARDGFKNILLHYYGDERITFLP
ncbi:hypothetical protein CBS101457_004735 [Exobasidium rhododendri]|nr:hypothetical protein CBS101457_004735 [Exobasidium rhododendri]